MIQKIDNNEHSALIVSKIQYFYVPTLFSKYFSIVAIYCFLFVSIFVYTIFPTILEHTNLSSFVIVLKQRKTIFFLRLLEQTIAAQEIIINTIFKN